MCPLDRVWESHHEIRNIRLAQQCPLSEDLSQPIMIPTVASTYPHIKGPAVTTVKVVEGCLLPLFVD